MPDLPRYRQRGRVAYDYAVTGVLPDGTLEPVPLLAGQTADFPYIRETSGDSLREQIDTSGEPGEQSLGSFWLRSQSTFDGGAYERGELWLDVTRDSSLFNRYAASGGVDPFQPGRVALLRRAPRAVGVPAGAAVIVLGVAAGGFDGALMIYQAGADIRAVSHSTAGATATVATIAGAELRHACSDGGAVHVLASNGLHRIVIGTWAVAQTHTGTVPADGVVGFVKERLVVGSGNTLVEVADIDPSPAVALPAPFFTAASVSWRAVAVTEGPETIYVGARDGARSTVLAVGLDATEAAPKLAYPVPVAELPTGEALFSLLVYMGSFLLMGTSAGVRVGAVRDGGAIATGPVTVYSDRPVRALHAQGESLYATGAVVQERDPARAFTPREGLYRVELGRTTDADGRRFAWATSLYAEGMASDPSRAATSVAPLGQSGRVAFAVPGDGLYVEHATQRVPSGWLRTGRIRMGTLEDKVFQLVKASCSVTPGLLSMWGATEGDVWEPLYDWDSSGIRAVEADGPDADPHLFLQLEFALYPPVPGSAQSPVLTGYQVKASPSQVVGRNIRVSALCYPRETDRNGATVERSTWHRLLALEAAEKKGALVLLQDFGAGTEDYARIRQIQFVSTHVPEGAVDRADLGGVLLLSLEAV